MKVIIAGSRTITDYATVCRAVERSGFSISRVLSGMAAGVDTLAVRYAKDSGLPLDPYPAQWNKWGRSAGYKRNVLMADNADALIAVWDGRSPGTRHMIQVAKARGVQVFVACASVGP
jgi:YspA, cpYpsA-related SLOG family